jgi:hypothetical protein
MDLDSTSAQLVVSPVTAWGSVHGVVTVSAQTRPDEAEEQLILSGEDEVS